VEKQEEERSEGRGGEAKKTLFHFLKKRGVKVVPSACTQA
jgi:hypothetical protein